MCDVEREAEEMKSNRAGISFPCCDTNGDCVYGKFTDEKFPKICLYLGSNMKCTSVVARVNRMVLECKNLGFEVEAKKQ